MIFLYLLKITLIIYHEKSYIFLLLFGVTLPAFSQFFENQKGITKYNGFIPFYYDETTDKIFLEISKVNMEFLYVHAFSEGIGSNDIGLDREVYQRHSFVELRMIIISQKFTIQDVISGK